MKPAVIEAFDPAAGWPEPKPLPPELPPVQAFDLDLAPAILRPWIDDIAERMQCPPDYLAVAAMVAAGAVVGRRLGIRPQEQTDWLEVPNLFGCVVGRPGVMKSPALKQALAPLRLLDARSGEDNAQAKARHAGELSTWKATRSALDAAMKKGAAKALAAGEPFDASTYAAGPEPTPPPERRRMVNDVTYEALGVVMAENPNGVLAFRDEITGLLTPLGREENASARGFFLEAWNGTHGYTFNRIMRGTLHIEACCLSLLGGTQPAKLASYLRHAVHGGEGDDGFAQRFGLLVWPDVSADWRDVDCYPQAEARRRVNLAFERLDAFSPEDVGAECDQHEPIPFLRFAPDAQGEFRVWRATLESRIRSGALHSAFESHLSKYRGLAPKLALLCHLIDGGTGPVSIEALTRALAWTDYLETHAARAYAAVTAGEKAAARAILAKLRTGELASPFTARDVTQREWSGLTDRNAVGEALDLLDGRDWLTCERLDTGGRPKATYTLNPRALRP